jgi:hypothetical protein
MIKKLLTAFSFLFVFIAARAQFPAPYCQESYGSGVEPITSVVFANINNTSPAATGGSNPHDDFLTVVGDVLRGATYQMTVKGNTDGNYTSYIRVFIDWNKDNDFDDANESINVGTITNSTGLDAISASVAITVPVNQPAGNVRMRVTKKYLSYQTACNTTGFGQAEDYTLSVTVPSCLSPAGVTITNISATSATVNWNAVAGAINYEYAVTTASLAPETGLEVESSGVVATGLSPNTLYYAHVRTNCGAGGLSIWTTVSFTTKCNVANVPYAENFNGVTPPAIPSCIVTEDFNAGSFWTTRNTPATVVIGAPNSMVYGYNTTIPGDDWFYLQGLNLTAGTSYRLSFKWKSNPALPERFEVSYGNTPTADSMNVNPIYTNLNAASSAVVTQTIDFTPTVSGPQYIGFHIFSVADQDFLAIDDISVIETPNCLNPTELKHTPASATSTTVSWRTVPGATGYQWVVNTSATPPASGAATTDTFALASSLVASTGYYAHVRTSCSGGSFSPWSTLAFGWIPNDSACGAIPLTIGGAASCANTALATSVGDPSLPGGCSAPNNTVWYSYTPTVSGPVVFKSEIPAGTTNGLNGWVAWYTITSCPNPSFTVVPGSVCQSFGPLAGDVDRSTSPSLVAGTTYYIMIDGVFGDVGEACFSIEAVPPPAACVANVAPANNATGVNVSPAPTFTWRSDANANGYLFIIGTTNPPTDTLGIATDTTVTIPGLNFNTTYYWYTSPVGLGGDAIGCVGNTTSFTTSGPATNCLPGIIEGCSFADRIDLFRLKGENDVVLNIATTSQCNADSYIDTTDHPTIIDLARGKTYWGQARAGTGGDYLTLWLDGNDNGLFEDNERLMNNLLISASANTNFNLFIPLSTPTGIHRLRARLVYYFEAPTDVTDPCGYYNYGETEDYRVNIVDVGTPYTIATYPANNACYTASGAIVVDNASNNNAGYVPLVDSSNALIAQLYPLGNNLGRVTTSYYKHNGPVRQDANGRYYLDRNLTITVAQQPTSAYNLRFPYENAELNALIAQPGSGVTSQLDLVMTKNQNPCSTAINTSGASTLYFPTGFGSLGSNRFVDVTNITGGFSSFYLHGGVTPLPVNLVSFKVQRTGATNSATWTTSQEINTQHFVVERSSDGRNFATIGQLDANGNSNSLLNYSFADERPARGINYYRLKIVDRDNSFKYSAIRSVRNDGLADVSVYPNPVKNELMINIDADKAGTGTLLVTDFSGKVLYNHAIKLVKGNNKLPINTSSLAGGTYLLTLQLAEDRIVKKFNKL